MLLMLLLMLEPMLSNQIFKTEEMISWNPRMDCQNEAEELPLSAFIEIRDYCKE
jgi:hypothetical protein